MTSTTGNRLPQRYTVRTVRTVRRHTPATVRGAGDATAATVRRPSNAEGPLLPTDAPMSHAAASPPYLRGPRFNADDMDGLQGRGRSWVLPADAVPATGAGTVPRQVCFVRRRTHKEKYHDSPSIP